jgi:flagellar export protein FliJ
MTRAFPLQSLLDLSQLRLDEAGRKLGELIAGELEASQRHGLLVTYREEYQVRFLAAAQGGLSPGEWQNYTGFLAKLDEAIAQADSAMTHTKQQTVAGQQNGWPSVDASRPSIPCRIAICRARHTRISARSKRPVTNMPPAGMRKRRRTRDGSPGWHNPCIYRCDECP